MRGLPEAEVLRGVVVYQVRGVEPSEHQEEGRVGDLREVGRGEGRLKQGLLPEGERGKNSEYQQHMTAIWLMIGSEREGTHGNLMTVDKNKETQWFSLYARVYRLWPAWLSLPFLWPEIERSAGRVIDMV